MRNFDKLFCNLRNYLEIKGKWIISFGYIGQRQRGNTESTTKDKGWFRMERIHMNSKLLLKKMQKPWPNSCKTFITHPVYKETRKLLSKHGSGFNQKTVKPKTINKYNNKLNKISRFQIDQRQLFYKHNILFPFFSGFVFNSPLKIAITMTSYFLQQLCVTSGIHTRTTLDWN